MTKRTTLRDIAIRVCEKHGLTMDQLVGPSRRYMYAHPRQEMMYHAFVECPHLSYPEIGRRMGRDHTSVIFGVKRHCGRIGITYHEAKSQRAGLSPIQGFTSLCEDYRRAMEAHRA